MAEAEYAQWEAALIELRLQPPGSRVAETEKANTELEKWWGRLSAHPDVVNEREAGWAKWEAAQEGKGAAALGWLRSVVPANNRDRDEPDRPSPPLPPAPPFVPLPSCSSLVSLLRSLSDSPSWLCCPAAGVTRATRAASASWAVR